MRIDFFQGYQLNAHFLYSITIYIIIIGIQPLGRFGQRPELSQATGMDLVRCILGKFLGVLITFYYQLTHTTLKNVELLKHFKIDKNAPTCFCLHGNHLQGAKVSTWLKVTRLVKQ